MKKRFIILLILILTFLTGCDIIPIGKNCNHKWSIENEYEIHDSKYVIEYRKCERCGFVETPIDIKKDCDKIHKWKLLLSNNEKDVFFCEICNYKREESKTHNTRYLKDVMNVSLLEDSFSVKFDNRDGSFKIENEQKTRLKEIIDNILNCEIIPIDFCDCYNYMDINLRYYDNDVYTYYDLFVHNHGVIFRCKGEETTDNTYYDAYFLIKENMNFNASDFEYLRKAYLVNEEKIVCEKYDRITSFELENLFLNDFNNLNYGFKEFTISQGYNKLIPSFNTSNEVIEYIKNEKHYSGDYLVSINLIEETDYFYIVNVVSKSKKVTYTHDYVSYKLDYFDYVNKKFFTDDKELIKKISDTLVKTYYSELIDTLIVEKDSYYEYYKYFLSNSFLEVDASAYISFYREEYRIDKETGIFEFIAKKQIKQIFLNGNEYNIWAPDEIIENFVPQPIVFDVTNHLLNSEHDDIKNLLQSLEDNKVSTINKVYNLRSDDIFFNYREIVPNWQTLDSSYDGILVAYNFSFNNQLVENSIFRNMYLKDGKIYINNLINVNTNSNIMPLNDTSNVVYIKLLLVPKSWSQNIDTNSIISINELYLD